MWMMMLLSEKNIAIFGYKQWLLSIDMKTKVVQHVKRVWIREGKSERVTFEHRHENKSCLEVFSIWGGGKKKCIAIFGYKHWVLSIDREQKTKKKQKLFTMPRQTEWDIERVRECQSERVRDWILSIDMKTKVVQHVERDWIYILN